MLARARLLRATFACAGVAALVLAATPTASATITAPVAPASPWVVGTTVTPGNGQVVWTEDFSNQDLSTNPVGLADYTGATNEKYTAGAQWLSTAHACNGWILTSATQNLPASAVDAQCTSDGGRDSSASPGHNHAAWWFLERMTEALGEAQGLNNNAALASETNRHAAMTDTIQFQQPASTSSPAAQAIPGHYYVASILVAAVHCPGDPNDPGGANRWTEPVETLSLTVGSTVARSVTPASADQVCGSAGTVYQESVATGPDAGTVDVHVLRMVTDPVIATSAGALGMTLADNDHAYAGNDLAFDTPTIIDVTPKLDKQISADGSTAGPSASMTGVSDTATLTFTITNAYSDPQAAHPSVLDPKLGWSFTDTLPTGMTVDSVPSQGPNACAATTIDVASIPGAIQVTGDLPGQAFCTVMIDVNVSTSGTYVNGPTSTSAAGGTGNFGAASGIGYSDIWGLWAPSNVTLTVPAASPPPTTRSAPPPAPQAGPVGASSNTGGGVTASGALWPMLALIVTGLAVWLTRSRRLAV